LFFSDVEKTLSTLISMDIRYLLAGIGLWSVGVLFRIVRWHVFLKSITREIPFIRSSLYFLSGFAFLFSPARVGEMLRSPIIKRDYNIPISKTASIVLVERFYDLLAVTIVIAVGLFFTTIDKSIVLIPLGIITFIVLIIKNKNSIKKIFEKLSKIKILNKIIPNVDDSFEVTYTLLKPRYFAVGILASIGVALLEVTAVYLFIIGLSGNIDFQNLIVLFHVVNFVAAASMIPGGIGIFEGGLVGLLVLYKLKFEVAFAVTVLIRIVSTGLFTIVGLIALRLISKDK
jgi:uncharacterized protein (TIRG00374 family)